MAVKRWQQVDWGRWGGERMGGPRIEMAYENLPAILDVLGLIADVFERDRIEKKALTKAGQLIAKSAKQKAPIGSPTVRHSPPLMNKLLKKSIGFAIKRRKRSRLNVAIIGARTGFKVKIGERQVGGKHSNPGSPVYQNPVPYAHLVELGVPALGIPARPFLRPAFDENLEASVKVMADVVYQEITKLGLKTATGARKNLTKYKKL